MCVCGGGGGGLSAGQARLVGQTEIMSFCVIYFR